MLTVSRLFRTSFTRVYSAYLGILYVYCTVYESPPLWELLVLSLLNESAHCTAYSYKNIQNIGKSIGSRRSVWTAKCWERYVSRSTASPSFCSTWWIAHSICCSPSVSLLPYAPSTLPTPTNVIIAEAKLLWNLWVEADSNVRTAYVFRLLNLIPHICYNFCRKKFLV